MNHHARLQATMAVGRPNRIAATLSCAALLSLAVLTAVPWGKAGTAPCCTVAAIDSHTGLVRAYVNSTGQPFVLFVKDLTTRQTLTVGQVVYANFSLQQASLDGRTACCAILVLGKVNPRTQVIGAARPLTRPPGFGRSPGTAKPSAGFTLSPGAPTGTGGNPAVIFPSDWLRRASIQVRSVGSMGQYTITSAAQYNALGSKAVPGLSPLETLLHQGRGGLIDNYYLVDATASTGSPKPIFPQGGTGGGGGGRGTGGTGSGGPGNTSSNDPAKFIANAQPGDIILASHPCLNYDTFGDFNHAAMVITPNWGWGTESAGALLVEEYADKPGTDKPGAHLVFWSDFIDSSRDYNKIALVRVRGLNDQQRNEVVDWAISRLGRPYRWPTDIGAKDDDNRMYCSQYVWIDYLRTMNIDLDSDGGYIVFPDDIYGDQYVDHIGELDLPASCWCCV